MDTKESGLTPYTLEDADRELRTASRRKPTEFSYWEVRAVPAIFSLAAMSFFLAWAKASSFVVASFIILMMLVALMLIVLQLVEMLLWLRRANSEFFAEMARQVRRQDAIIERLMLNGSAWTKEHKVRLQNALEFQNHRAQFLLGRWTGTGLVPLAFGLYWIYRLKQIPADLGVPWWELWAGCVVLGMFAGHFAKTLSDQHLRRLVQALTLAEQRLDDKAKAAKGQDVPAQSS